MSDIDLCELPLEIDFSPTLDADSDQQHDDAVVAAVAALQFDQLQKLLRVDKVFPFWRAMHALCHAYVPDQRWKAVAVLTFHARTWDHSQALPESLPTFSQLDPDHPLREGVSQALLGVESWNIDAFRVLLALGVPYIGPLVLDELLEQASDLTEHLRALADHFGTPLFSLPECMQYLSEHLTSSHKKADPDFKRNCWDAAQFFLYVLFRWHLRSINVNNWLALLQPVRDVCLDESKKSAGYGKVSASVAESPALVNKTGDWHQIDVLLKGTFFKLAKEEGARASLWCSNLRAATASCSNLLCKHVHTHSQLQLRNPLLRLVISAERRRSPLDELNDAVLHLLAQSPHDRRTCLYALNSVLLLLQTYLRDSLPSPEQLRGLSRTLVLQLSSLSRAYYTAELEERVLRPLLEFWLSGKDNKASDWHYPARLNSYFFKPQFAPATLHPPLRVLVSILSLLQQQHVEKAAWECRFLVPDIRSVHFHISSSWLRSAGELVSVPVPLLPLFINFQSTDTETHVSRKPSLLHASAGVFRLCADPHAPPSLGVEFTHFRFVFPSAKALVLALHGAKEANAIMLSGHTMHSDYLGPSLLWFTPSTKLAPSSDAPSLSRSSSRFGAFEIEVPVHVLLASAGAEPMRWLKLGTRQLEHRRLLSNALSVEWAHSVMLTSRPAFAVGNPFGAEHDKHSVTWIPSSCAIPELHVHNQQGISSSSSREAQFLSYDPLTQRAIWRPSHHTGHRWDELKIALPLPTLLLRAADGVRLNFVNHAVGDDICHSAPSGAHEHHGVACRRTKQEAADEFLQLCDDREFGIQAASWRGLLSDAAAQLIPQQRISAEMLFRKHAPSSIELGFFQHLLRRAQQGASEGSSTSTSTARGQSGSFDGSSGFGAPRGRRASMSSRVTRGRSHSEDDDEEDSCSAVSDRSHTDASHGAQSGFATQLRLAGRSAGSSTRLSRVQMQAARAAAARDEDMIGLLSPAVQQSILDSCWSPDRAAADSETKLSCNVKVPAQMPNSHTILKHTMSSPGPLIELL